jgi:hypothetical protein
MRAGGVGSVVVARMIRCFGWSLLWRQQWATDTGDLLAGDPRYRVLIVVTAAMSNR